MKPWVHVAAARKCIDQIDAGLLAADLEVTKSDIDAAIAARELQVAIELMFIYADELAISGCSIPLALWKHLSQIARVIGLDDIESECVKYLSATGSK